MTEREWQTTVVDAARAFGWLTYHTHDSRRSNPGFPDLVLVRDHRLIFAELKTDKGRLTHPQLDWIGRLEEASYPRGGRHPNRFEVEIWRPADWPTVEETLR